MKRLLIGALLLLPVAARPQKANCSGTRASVMGAECWAAGSSCERHGAISEFPVEIHGTVLKAGAHHGGCNPAQWLLVYEPKSSPLKVRVCMKAPPPMDCPAIVSDYASWDLASLLKANGATRVRIVKK